MPEVDQMPILFQRQWKILYTQNIGHTLFQLWCHFLIKLQIILNSVQDIFNKTSNTVKLSIRRLDKINTNTKHFYHLPFELDTLQKEQRKDSFFTNIISYGEDNHLPFNLKKQNSTIAESYNYLLFDNVLFHVANELPLMR